MTDFKLKLSRLKGIQPAERPKSTKSSTSVGLGDEFEQTLGFGRRQFKVGDVDRTLLRLTSTATGRRLVSDILNLQACVREDFDDVLFLDTETTGLGYSAGTYAFLVGIIYCAEGVWIGEQLCLNSPSEEEPMLRYLSHRLNEARTLVTYNGKSYDLPLLNVRLSMHKLPTITPPHHVDLYHVCRGVCKHRLARFRLCDLEAFVLDLVRTDDISGADIPSAYFAFLHGRDQGEMQQVIKHNTIDIESMVHLLDWLANLIERYDGFNDERIEYGVLERLVHRGAGDLVRNRLEILLDQSKTQWVRTRCALLMYEVYRHDDLEQGMSLLLAHFATSKGELRSTMAKRLAIHFEHQFKNFHDALIYAEETEAVEGWCAHRRRLARLRGKIDRSTQSELPATLHSFSRLVEAL